MPATTPRGRAQGAATRRNIPLLAALAATLACALLVLLHESGKLEVPGLASVEADTTDARFRLRGERRPAADDVAIVGFDDELRRQAPDVFQKRAGWGRFLDALARYEPRAVAIDAFFASPEVPLPEGVVAQVRAAHGGLTDEVVAGSPAVAAARDALHAVVEATRGDDDLATAVRRSGNVLLGVLFFLERGELHNYLGRRRHADDIGQPQLRDLIRVAVGIVLTDDAHRPLLLRLANLQRLLPQRHRQFIFGQIAHFALELGKVRLSLKNQVDVNPFISRSVGDERLQLKLAQFGKMWRSAVVGGLQSKQTRSLKRLNYPSRMAAFGRNHA